MRMRTAPWKSRKTGTPASENNHDSENFAAVECGGKLLIAWTMTVQNNFEFKLPYPKKSLLGDKYYISAQANTKGLHDFLNKAISQVS